MAHKYNVPAMWSEQMGQAVAKQNELAADAYSTDQTLVEMREGYRTERAFWNEGGPEMAAVTDHQVPTRHGDVRVRHYVPEGAATPSPWIVFIHGGGWMVGDVDTHDRIVRTLASLTGSVAVSIDYTLSPEAQYPRPIQECADVVAHIIDHAEAWGIDPDDVSFAGDSAGGNMSFGTMLYLRDVEKKPLSVRAMMAFYGAYGLRDSMSMRLLGGVWDGLTEKDYATYLAAYMSDLDLVSDPYFNILSNDLTGIAPCFLVAAGLDPLKDDTRCMDALLDICGIEHEFVEYPQVIHGFLHHSKMVDDTMDAMRRAADFYRAHPTPTRVTTPENN